MDDLALEFGEDPEHLEQGAPGRCGRVNGLPLKIEIAADRAEFCEKANEVLQATAEPINRPGRDNIDLAGGCRFKQPVEAGALFSTLGAADPLILELLDDPPASRLARRRPAPCAASRWSARPSTPGFSRVTEPLRWLRSPRFGSYGKRGSHARVGQDGLPMSKTLWVIKTYLFARANRVVSANPCLQPPSGAKRMVSID